MKKTLLFLIITIVMAGCTSTPKTEDDGEPFIWKLLRDGNDKARDYFHGEFEVNITDSEGRTPLHYAVMRRDSSLTSFFLSLGANPNILDHEFQSPLAIAIENGDVRIIELLAGSGADIHMPILSNTTGARFALTKGGGAFNALLTPSSVESTDADGKNVLHIASEAGNVQAVSQILSVKGTSSSFINKKDNAGKNALDYAFANPNSVGNNEIAELLILSGSFSENPIYSYFAPAARSANYNIRRNEGLAPIHYAVMGNYEGMLHFLFGKNVDINLKSTSGSTALHEAARNGNIPIINLLISKGADVNARDAKGNTPLHTGIPAGVHREIITILLSNEADPNLRDEHGDTPLHIVTILNRPLDVIQTLLNGGVDVNIRNIDGKTALYIAVQEGREALIPALVSYGAEIFAADNSGVTPFDLAFKADGNSFNLLITEETINQKDGLGNTVLHATVRNRGTSQQIGTILDMRPMVDSRNRTGDTALHIAVRTNQRSSSLFLISRGADIFSVNSAGESPLFLALNASPIREWIINEDTVIARDSMGNNMLHYAAQWKLDSAIPVILESGLLIESTNAAGETPLFMAIKGDSPSTIRTLVQHRANLNARDHQGNSLLHAAVRWNAINSAGSLIASGMDKNVHSLNGNTPLHDAIAFGMSDIENLLIKEGANLEVRNMDGNTPFMEAVRGAKTASIQKLAANGANISARNNRGDTPLHFAVITENYDVVSYLLRNNASIHARNTVDRTPFQLGLSSSSAAMVTTLLGSGRINIPDDSGNSALHIALQERASSEILRTIISGGAQINAVDSNGKTALRLAIDLNMLEEAKLIADAGADPFVAAVDSRSAADLSFVKGNDCLKAIFSGRGINARDSSENTILHYAARYGNSESINMLLDLGANKTIRNISSETPFDIAVRWNRAENAELLRPFTGL